jgi:hypothetical protein
MKRDPASCPKRASAPLWQRRAIDAESQGKRGNPMRHPLLILGVVALLIGLLWIGQGTGTVAWPQSSFMISQIQWAYYGAALAVVGLVLIWRGRR